MVIGLPGGVTETDTGVENGVEELKGKRETNVETTKKKGGT